MGVEIVEEAIEDAKRNAELNGFTNTYFESGPAEEVIPRWYQEGKRADVLVVDPPQRPRPGIAQHDYRIQTKTGSLCILQPFHSCAGLAYFGRRGIQNGGDYTGGHVPADDTC